MKPCLQNLALDFTTCLSNRITVDILWIPRTENREADAISRIINYDDFQYLANIHRDRRQYWLLLYEAKGRIQ